MITVIPGGDIWEESYDLRVNPVNCTGVMHGEFRKRYPEMYKCYLTMCTSRTLVLGSLHIWGECVVNLPTRMHYTDVHSLVSISESLKALRGYLFTLPKRSVAIPHLGGAWPQILALLEDRLGGLSHNICLMYP